MPDYEQAEFTMWLTGAKSKMINEKAQYILASFVCVLILLVMSTLYAKTNISDYQHLLPKTKTLKYDDARGTFTLKAVGNAGSIISMQMDFDGFYVFPNLGQTNYKQRTGSIMPKLQDVYHIVPQNIKITTDIRSVFEQKFVVSGLTSIYRTTNKDNRVVEFQTYPEPPGTSGPVSALYQWLGAAKQSQIKNSHQFYIDIHVTGEAQDEIWANVTANSFASGTCTTEQIGSEHKIMKSNAAYNFKFTANKAVTQDKIQYSVVSRVNAGINWNGMGLDVVKTEKSDNESLLDDLTIEYRSSASGVPPSFVSGGGSLESDTHFNITTHLYIGPKKEIDVVLECRESNGGTYYPDLMDEDGTREYVLKLNDPGHEDIDAIRFTLSDVSEHPGVATNAGNHVLHDQCPDCIIGKKDQDHTVSSTVHQNMVYRTYTHYNKCPIDQMPDLFFKDIDQDEDYDMGEGASIETLSLKEYSAKVAIKDSAASGKLSAEVMIGGVWYTAKTKGPEADTEEAHLLIPYDSDQNGLPDEWERREGVSDPDRDQDALPGNTNIGDGLTNFEEYRGIWMFDFLKRLSPNDLDIFIHDYHGDYLTYIFQTQALYSTQDLNLWPMDEDNFKSEIINYQTTEHRNGLQYILIIMNHEKSGTNINFDRLGGIASHIGPPVHNANTIILGLETMGDLLGDIWNRFSAGEQAYLPGLIGHEIGHNINVVHHGEADGYMYKDDDWVFVACQSGQHSGSLTCFMRYLAAEYFVKEDHLPQTAIGSRIQAWLNKLYHYPPSQKKEEKRIHFCKSGSGDGCCGCASQGRGNCLSQIKVKSY